MCDYSLEMYQSRPARAGERYETHRFASGSVGFIAPGNPDTAICFACDARVKLVNVPLHLRQALDESAISATFVRLDLGPHHDGVRLAGGQEVSLQQLGLGIEAYLLDDVRVPKFKVRDMAEAI